MEIGNEGNLDTYCSNLVSLFNRIPLHDKGSVWVNLGDKRSPDGGIYMVPERFAMKMMESGWILMDKVIWAKVVVSDDGSTAGGCMTEPANNRLNGNGHEFIYRFARTKDAWFDPQSVSIPRQEKGDPSRIRHMPEELMKVESSVEGRNLHNVWRVDMGQTKKKHYAVYPTTLCERPIAMSCPMKVCHTCGHLETRVVEKVEYDEGRSSKRVFGKYNSIEGDEKNEIRKRSGRSDIGSRYVPRKPVTTGWTSCPHRPVPGIVLDPFCGSGTTGEVALKMGRDFVGIDLYDNFLEMTKERCEQVIALLKSKKIDPWEERR
jgi:DNA modification methylase